MIKFTRLDGTPIHISKWAIVAIYFNGDHTNVISERTDFSISETVEEALKLWETTE